MARVGFLQLNQYELHGLESMSALLGARGHHARLVALGLEKNPLEAMAEFRPHIVGIGHTTVERAEALAWARAVKERTGALVLLGGVDPTFFPQNCLAEGVDAVVRGESELALAEIADRVDEGADFRDLRNIAYEDGGEVALNPMRPLIEDLDSLPFPDKDLYLGRYRYFRDYPIKFFMASRGCPHGCRYCANKGLRKLYPNPECYVRFKSPEYLLAEVESALSRYPARTVGFNDDLFTYREDWLEQFLPAFRERVGLPFFCTARIDKMTEKKARLLAESGCYTCWYGLESSNPEIREKVLGRRMSNDDIKEGTRILHRHGILTQSYNMMNLPGQTLEDGLDTLRFNIELKNEFVVASLFQPFPGTELMDELVAAGQVHDQDRLSSRETLSYFAFSPYRQKDAKALENLQKLFILANRHPGLAAYLEKLVKLPKNPIFDIIFLASFALDYGRSHRLSLWEVVRYNLRHLWTTYIARTRSVPGAGRKNKL